MLDSVKLKSPYLTERIARQVERQMVRTERVDLATGECKYSLTGNMLPGTWSERVSVRIERTELRQDRSIVRLLRQAGIHEKRKAVPIFVPSEPYILLEGSVHKALLGHNILGGPLDFEAACRWFVSDVARRLEVDLPDGSGWQVFRADWAEVYDLGSFEGVRQFIAGLNHADYPRRKAARFGEHSLHCGGYTTAVKFYSKGEEFGGNDGKRLRHLLSAGDLEALQLQANPLLRVEVAVKLRKLRAEFEGKTPVVGQVTRDYLESVHDKEASTLLREGQSNMETVRKFREVDNRLRYLYGNELGSILFSTWSRFVAVGEKEARKGMTRATYFRHKKQLQDAGCAWYASDLTLICNNAIPQGFSPVRSDPRRLTAEAPEVVSALAPFRLAA